MTRKPTSIAIVFGVLFTLLFSGVGMAQAGTANYRCSQTVGSGAIVCYEVDNDVKIELQGSRALNDNELAILMTELNGTPLTHDAIKSTIVNVFESFGVAIVKLRICIQGVCRS